MLNKISGSTNPIMNKTEQKNLNEANDLVDFKAVFKDALEKVNQAEKKANLVQEQFVEGKAVDLHHVMLTAQKASLMIETAVQVQQKVIDTYNEVMRMQI